MFACFAGQAAAADVLLKSGADPFVQDRCGERSALHYAIMHGSMGCVRAILANVPEGARTRRRPGHRHPAQ